MGTHGCREAKELASSRSSWWTASALSAFWTMANCAVSCAPNDVSVFSSCGSSGSIAYPLPSAGSPPSPPSPPWPQPPAAPPSPAWQPPSPAWAPPSPAWQPPSPAAAASSSSFPWGRPEWRVACGDRPPQPPPWSPPRPRPWPSRPPGASAHRQPRRRARRARRAWRAWRAWRRGEHRVLGGVQPLVGAGGAHAQALGGVPPVGLAPLVRLAAREDGVAWVLALREGARRLEEALPRAVGELGEARAEEVGPHARRAAEAELRALGDGVDVVGDLGAVAAGLRGAEVVAGVARELQRTTAAVRRLRLAAGLLLGVRGGVRFGVWQRGSRA